MTSIKETELETVVGGIAIPNFLTKPAPTETGYTEVEWTYATAEKPATGAERAVKWTYSGA